MFQVFDNDKPAQYDDTFIWNNSKFDTLEQAREYARGWLDEYGGFVIEPNKPYDYSGYGDIVEIREV